MPKGFFRRAFCGGRFLRRTVLAAGRAVFAATGFRSPAPASVGSRRRFRTGRPPPRTSCVPGCVFRIRCPEVRASRTVHRRPCGAACVPRTGSEDRLSAASVRRRNAAERTFPFRCGEGSQYDTGDCGDAAHRTGGCPQRSDPVRRRGGAFRGRSDGACRTQRGVDRGRCANSRTAGQKGRRPDSFGKRKNADAARSCAGSEPVRRAGSANVGGGKTDVRLPDRKNGAETNMGRAAGAWS